jgi:hypothetical protein
MARTGSSKKGVGRRSNISFLIQPLNLPFAIFLKEDLSNPALFT